MKYLLCLFLLVVACTGAAFAQPATGPTPPNTALVAGNLYADKTEVANIHWLEFLHYIRRDSGEAYYQKMLPDTLVWAQRNLAQAQMSAPALSTNYLRSPEFRFHPVVGISYEQALAYAQWRTALVNRLLNTPEELAKWGLEGKKVVVEYRLPTEEEWQQAASGLLSADKYPYGHKKYQEKARKQIAPKTAWEQLAAPKPDFTDFKKAYRKAELPLVHVVAELPFSTFSAPEFPQPASTGITNTTGLTHTIGNVAEMVAGPGIAKGGSFMHTLKDSEIQDTQPYFGPAPWLGVRYVATVRIEEE